MGEQAAENGFVKQFLEQYAKDLKKEEIDAKMQQLVYKPVNLKLETTSKIHKNKNKTKRILPQRIVKLKNCKYGDYESLRNLWKSYLSELITSKDGQVLNVKSCQETLLKADFHGAVFTVVKSKCKSNEKICGTVVGESKNMFQIVTNNDKVVKIPKKGSIFEVKYSGYRITIFGDQFCLKPAHRLTKKFKNYVPTLALV